MKLGDFKLDWMNENYEESRRQKYKWLNELVKATWLEGQDLVKDLIKKLFEDINGNISNRTFFKVNTYILYFSFVYFPNPLVFLWHYYMNHIVSNCCLNLKFCPFSNKKKKITCRNWT